LYAYNYPCNRLIAKYKYHRCAEIADCFAHYFNTEITNNINGLPDIIVPVPLHRNKQRQRGFNQSALLARRLACKLATPYTDKLIFRPKETRSQASLSAALRRKNISNAFVIAKSCENKNVVLVDDVLTTGTTANEVARLLKRHGAKTVSLWIMARAGFYKKP